jgi:hypothetical protein
VSGSHPRFARALAFTGEPLRGSQQSAEEPSTYDKTKKQCKSAKTVQNSILAPKRAVTAQNPNF